MESRCSNITQEESHQATKLLLDRFRRILIESDSGHLSFTAFGLQIGGYKTWLLRCSHRGHSTPNLVSHTTDRDAHVQHVMNTAAVEKLAIDAANAVLSSALCQLWRNTKYQLFSSAITVNSGRSQDSVRCCVDDELVVTQRQVSLYRECELPWSRSSRKHP